MMVMTRAKIELRHRPLPSQRQMTMTLCKPWPMLKIRYVPRLTAPLLSLIKFQDAISRPQAVRTADIRAIFTFQKEYLHPDTGKTLKGHWCTVCR